MGNVSTAVAERQSQQPAQVSPQMVIKHTLEQFRPIIANLLAKTGVDEPTFVAQIANALRSTPTLLRCDPKTVLGAALKAAQLGLAPNDTRNLCWIIPYNDTAQFQMGYGGYLELARRAEPGVRFAGRAVYPNDRFDVDFGRDQPLQHTPAGALRLDRGGDAYLWYLHVRHPDGTQDVFTLDKQGVEYHRSFSKQANGQMWTNSYDAAALKSVVLDAKRWLPSSPQLTIAFAADEQTFNVTEMPTDDEAVAEASTPKAIDPVPDEHPADPAGGTT